MPNTAAGYLSLRHTCTSDWFHTGKWLQTGGLTSHGSDPDRHQRIEYDLESQSRLNNVCLKFSVALLSPLHPSYHQTSDNCIRQPHLGTRSELIVRRLCKIRTDGLTCCYSLEPMLASLSTVATLLASLTILAPQAALAAPVGQSLAKRSDFSKSLGPHFLCTGGEADIAAYAEPIRKYKDSGAGKIRQVQVLCWRMEGALAEVWDTITDENEPEKMNQNMFDGVSLDLTFTRVGADFKSKCWRWGYRLLYTTYPADLVGGDPVNNIDSQRMPMEWWVV